MASEPILAALDVPAALPRRLSVPAIVADFWALTKPEVNFLIVVSTFAGFYMGGTAQAQDFPFWRMFNTLLGTLLVASGTGTLNQYLERRFDAQMRRTARRPLAAGRLNPSAVLWFGVALSAVGSIYLAAAVNVLASLLAIATLLSYLFLYTPLKRRTAWCVLVGAIPGAAPPLIGWAAAAGTLSFEAWILYAFLFLWQFPHFMAIAWMYREDYDRAGYLVLPREEPARARFLNWQALLPLSALMPVSLLPSMFSHSRAIYCVVALLLSGGFFCYGAEFVLHKSRSSARRLLAASIIYLPLLLALVALPKA
jgi:protoheme IX farnesyltransferase